MRRVLAATIVALIFTGSSYTEAASEVVEGKALHDWERPNVEGRERIQYRAASNGG